MTAGDGTSDAEKARIASDFILHAPPGEFNEVFNDVRVLLGNDGLLRDACAGACAKYSKEQLLSVRLPGQPHPVLVSKHNELGGGRFFDPRSGQSFRYDDLRKEASESAPTQPPFPKAEEWRKALQTAVDDYAAAHYQVTDKTGNLVALGVVGAFGGEENGRPKLTLAIESSKLEPKNFSNGRWRSEWSYVISGEKSIEVKGTVRVQVHYYEDGNVQLVSSKEIIRSVPVTDPLGTARAVLKVVAEEEDNYQLAAKGQYEMMSKSTLKTLRRPLPLTKTLMDWTKALGQGRVVNELRPV